MPTYAPGTPSWVELSSPDPDASAAFYRDVLGWGATEPGSAETGGYRMFQCGDKNVAGLMGHMQEGQPTAWATYVSVADAEETSQKVLDAGGSVVVAPMDVMDLGRMAVFVDPTGAVFGVWQPKAFAGADLVNEPVSLTWNEVHTRDVDTDKAFYGSVFGWTAGRPEFEGAPDTYTVWQLDVPQRRRHDGDGRGDVPARDAAALERLLRGGRRRRDRRQGPRARRHGRGRAGRHADRALRGDHRPAGGVVHDHAAGALAG
jgi:predicted enzyme related to lactoylglutathione lyase